MIPSTDQLLIDKLNRLIDDNLGNPAFSIDAICQALGISRSHLHRILKEQADRSTSLYIRQRRLVKARHLLLTTALRISEVCDAVGITNPQNFSTYFTEEFGIRPTEFRKSQGVRANGSLAESQPVSRGVVNGSRTTEAIADLPTGPAARRPPFWTRWRMGLGGLVVLILVGAGLYAWIQFRPASRSAQPTDNSIAVLPFTNLGPVDTAPVCEVVMGELHSSVSLLKNLKVIARSSSDRYRDSDKTTWQIGDELQVANVLKGSILKTADQIQIKVEIVSTQDDIRTWAKTYRAPYGDIFQLTDQIVQEVAGQLKLSVGTPTAEKLALARTKNLEAYNLLVQGRQLLVSRLDADVLAGLARFDRALALDSTFAEAYALKAVAYHLLIGSKKWDTPTINRLTEENALKAIRLDPTNSTAYAVLGSLYYLTHQWQASENAFRIALQHNSNDAQANYWYSLLLRTMGRLDEAVQYSTQAIALDPLHPIIMAGHIVNCTYAGRFDLAQAGIETGQGLFDQSFAYQDAKGDYWMTRADYSRAVASLQQALRLNPDDRGHVPVLIYCEAKRGNRPKALRFLRELTATTPRANYERAVVYAGLAQADSSLYFLKKAADGGYLYRDTKAMIVFRPYHSHPVFKAVMRQFKLPEE